MADLIIPGLILLGFVVIIAVSFAKSMNEAEREEAEAERRKLYDLPSMDLRMGDDPCATCIREPECMGVDQPHCERYNSMRPAAGDKESNDTKG